jgi:S1-C subfamily serine protease
MRAPVAIVLGLASAVVGGLIALGIAETTGLGGESRTVVVSTPAPPPSASPATAPPVRPRAGAFDAAALYRARAGGVVTIYARFAGAGTQGSGFIVDRHGVILTNAHVITNVAESSGDPRDVRGADALYVEFRDGERVPATIVGWDLFSDVGVLRVEPATHALQALPLGDSSAVAVGSPVAAIGSPFGNQTSLSVGVVSATGRQIDSLTSRYAVADAIQIDAPINRGNSGGPLFDASGRVIGVNAQIRSSSGTAEGVGFAIPINTARRALDQLLRNGKVSYAYIGIESQDLTPGIARAFNLMTPRGALIARVQPGTPAERAGLRAAASSHRYNGLDVFVGGDVIVRIGSSPVRRSEDVSRIVAEELSPGQTVPFVVFRQGTRREVVPVTVVERPIQPD